MSIWISMAPYIFVMIIVSNYIGGIRCEMDGIGDMAIVLFWPIWLLVKIIAFLYRIPASIGKRLKALKDGA